MSVCIVMCTFRKGKVAEAHNLWGDLRVALWSLHSYVPSDVDIHVAWEGPAEPDLVPNAPNFHYYERPPLPGLADAMNWLVAKTDTDGFVMVPDDAVFTPTTWTFLMQDLAAIEASPRTKVGLLGCRSNFVVGPQNIRSANGGRLSRDMRFYDNESVAVELPSVFPVIGWFDRAIYEQLGQFPPGLHWFGDNLYSFDLHQANLGTYMSRSYVHHIGARGTKSADNITDIQLAANGIAWLRENRPDFYATLRLTNPIVTEISPEPAS